ncbi:MAG: hypothetical protein M1522_02645 [Actinobacteria bacterium]|nr:hypothetical protein [Actinomycetota bacterium]
MPVARVPPVLLELPAAGEGAGAPERMDTATAVTAAAPPAESRAVKPSEVARIGQVALLGRAVLGGSAFRERECPSAPCSRMQRARAASSSLPGARGSAIPGSSAASRRPIVEAYPGSSSSRLGAPARASGELRRAIRPDGSP